jgi:hypothetical protein
MTGSTKFETLPYLLIITRYGGSEILLSSIPESLPSLDVASGGRLAEQLVTATKQKYRLESYCLWATVRTILGGDSAPWNYAVMEVLDQNASAPTGTLWASPREALPRVGGADRGAVCRFLEDLERYAADPERAPFAKPAWIQELLSWAGAQVKPFDLRVTGGFWQLNASPTFSLIRLQTNRTAVWFKATGEPHAHELSVSLALAHLMPEFAPRILGVHPRWNGWLSSHVAGKLLREVNDRSAWETAARTLARLQIRSLQIGAPIRESGVRDLEIQTLAEQIEPFLDCVNRLMEAQEQPSPPPLSKSDLAAIRDQLGEAFERLGELRAFDCLGRFDLNPGNIIVSGDRAVFLDWAEAYWGHPFFSFIYLFENFRRQVCDLSFETALRSSYCEPWQTVCAAEKVSEALAMAPLLAAFAYTVAGRSWREPEALRDPRVAGHLRSMTRRMHLEAKRMARRRETCLS